VVSVVVIAKLISPAPLTREVTSTLSQSANGVGPEVPTIPPIGGALL
jgi:hypothetical protein